jgi:hypothetical protein
MVPCPTQISFRCLKIHASTALVRKYREQEITVLIQYEETRKE